MPKAPSAPDAFTAIAEPRRRELLSTLAKSQGQHDVSWLVGTLGWPQPQVSKQLGVLRKAGLVIVHRKGKRRMYTLNGEELKPVFEWLKTYEHFWDHQLGRIKARAESQPPTAPLAHPSTPPSNP